MSLACSSRRGPDVQDLRGRGIACDTKIKTYGNVHGESSLMHAVHRILAIKTAVRFVSASADT